MPAETLGFTPVPAVHSIAEQMLHLASTDFSDGSCGSGAKNPSEGKDLQTHHWRQTTIYRRLNGIVPPPEPC